MKKLAVLLALGALIYAGYFWLHPTPEKIIQDRLKELAKVASFQGEEAPLAKLYNAQKLSSFCSPAVEVTVNLPGRHNATVSGRDEVMKAVAATRQSLRGLQVDFLDVTVQLARDGASATALLTARVRVTGDRDDYIQELRFTFQKVDGEWLIVEVQTIETLTLLQHPE